MISIHEEFDTEAEAIAFRDRMYQAYHPLGYSTHIRIEPRHDSVPRDFRHDGRGGGRKRPAVATHNGVARAGKRRRIVAINEREDRGKCK